MEMGYADWVVAKYLANYSIRWIAEQTGTAQAMVKATLRMRGVTLREGDRVGQEETGSARKPRRR